MKYFQFLFILIFSACNLSIETKKNCLPKLSYFSNDKVRFLIYKVSKSEIKGNDPLNISNKEEWYLCVESQNNNSCKTKFSNFEQTSLLPVGTKFDFEGEVRSRVPNKLMNSFQGVIHYAKVNIEDKIAWTPLFSLSNFDYYPELSKNEIENNRRLDLSITMEKWKCTNFE